MLKKSPAPLSAPILAFCSVLGNLCSNRSGTAFAIVHQSFPLPTVPLCPTDISSRLIVQTSPTFICVQDAGNWLPLRIVAPPLLVLHTFTPFSLSWQFHLCVRARKKVIKGPVHTDFAMTKPGVQEKAMSTPSKIVCECGPKCFVQVSFSHIYSNPLLVEVMYNVGGLLSSAIPTPGPFLSSVEVCILFDKSSPLFKDLCSCVRTEHYIWCILVLWIVNIALQIIPVFFVLFFCTCSGFLKIC